MTAANASGICDGAGSLVIVSEEAVKEHGLKPLARLVSWSRSGCDPSLMGIGPVESIKGALKVGAIVVDRSYVEHALDIFPWSIRKKVSTSQTVA